MLNGGQRRLGRSRDRMRREGEGSWRGRGKTSIVSQPIIQLAVVQPGKAFPGEAHTSVRVAALEFRAALQRPPAPRFSK